MLAIVVAILFILIVLVLGLHMSQSKAVRNVTQAEAELQFRQSFEFEVATLMAKDEPLPSWVKVRGDTDLLSDLDLARDYGKSLFSEEGLPNLTPADHEYPPGFQTYKVTPKTSDAALDVFGKKYQWLVTQASSGYGAYAPKGKISLESARGWSNPTLDDERESADAFSGVPVMVACEGDLQVDEMTYGQGYSRSGEITLGGPGGIGFRGNLPLRAYEQKLQDELESLKGEMARVAASGDKTGQIKGDFLQTASSMVTMLFGGNNTPGLNLEQAMKVPFPSIPGGSATIPGVLFEFWVHVPYPPDFADFSDAGYRDSEADAEEAKRLDEAIKAVEKRISELEEEKRRAVGQLAKDEIQVKIDDKTAELRALEREAKDLEDEVKEDSRKRNDAVGNAIGGNVDEPVTRSQDEGIPNTGIRGWAYGPVFEGFGSFLLKLVTGKFKELAGSVVNEVRVIHFGRKEFEPDFRFDNGFYAKATFTVPPGRTFRYAGDCDFEGDLWLQKGSVMHVGGDLTLRDPNGGSRNPFKASGKLVLEEGATLVVDGDVRLAGSDLYGSLWVCSRAGRVAPISTAILADGSVSIPHGSYTATSLEDAAKWVAIKESRLEFLPGLLDSVFSDVAPNLAKLAGPFHRRQPFFASYAATFQLTFVPTPFGPVPVPSAVPINRDNALVPIFRGFTYLYTPAMNASLGENFYTHADWWGFGEGTVPVLPKVDPVGMVRALTAVNLGGLNLNFDFQEQLNNLSNQVLQTAMNTVIELLAKKIVTQIATAFLPGGGALNSIISETVEAFESSETALDRLQNAALDATLGPIVSEFERWVDDLRDQVENGIAEGYLREVNGPLIYAETISVGDLSTPRLMAGMLVAKRNITVEAHTFVGSMTCFDGDISGQNFYFTPQFLRASLYKPKATESNWIARAVQHEYGKRFDSKAATGISTGVRMVRTEGWSQ